MVPREGGNPAVIFMGQMLLFFGIFYFLLIRPQKREQEKKREMLAALAKGDEVITAGGVIGTILKADDSKLTIKTAEETRLVVDRGHVTRKLTGE